MVDSYFQQGIDLANSRRDRAEQVEQEIVPDYSLQESIQGIILLITIVVSFAEIFAAFVH